MATKLTQPKLSRRHEEATTCFIGEGEGGEVERTRMEGVLEEHTTYRREAGGKGEGQQEEGR